MSTWRENAAPVISKVIQANPEADEKTLRKLISAAYPFGQRAYHPYKIWLSEVKKQLAARFHKSTFNGKKLEMRRAGQLSLIEETR